MADDSPGPAPFSWAQKVSLGAGAFYLLFGITGLFFSRAAPFAGHDTHATMFGLELNGAQNILHVFMGVVGLVCTTSGRSARAYGAALAVVGAALFVFGAVAAGNDAVNVLSLNWPDNVLHGLTALVGVAVLVRRTDERAETGQAAPR